MSHTITPATPTTPTTPDLAAEVRMLRETMENMHGLAHEGLSSIGSVARLAMLAFEDRHAYQNPGLIWDALHVILDKAGVTLTCIEAEAEEAGSEFVSPGLKRRIAAEMAFRESLKGVNHGQA